MIAKHERIMARAFKEANQGTLTRYASRTDTFYACMGHQWANNRRLRIEHAGDYDAIPPACPTCQCDGMGNGIWGHAILDGILADGRFQAWGDWDKTLDKDSQAVRFECHDCDERIPLTKRLHEELQLKHSDI